MHEYLEDLVGHLEWADATLWETVLGCEGAGDDEKLVFWLHHIHLVQHAFRRVWQDESLKDLPQLTSFDALLPLESWGREGHGALRSYLRNLSETEMERKLRLPWASQFQEKWGRPMEPVKLSESVIQVAMHSTHHRAQVAARLRELGTEPPLTDFIAWLWWGRPEAKWPV